MKWGPLPRRRLALHDRRRRHRAIAKMRSHFLYRLAERAPGVDGPKLFDQLCIAISLPLEHRVEKVCRLPGRRECWRFRVEGQTLYAVWDPRFMCPVTVLPAGFKVRKAGRGKFKKLRDVA